MTVTQAIEQAFYNLLQGASLGESTTVRCWHNVRADTSWDWTKDRSLPCVEITASPPVPDDNYRTYSVRVVVKAYTQGNDDKAHETIGAIEEAIQARIDALYYDLFNGRTGSAWVSFYGSILDDTSNKVAGLRIEQGDEPSDDDGNPSVGFVVIVNYSK